MRLASIQSHFAGATVMMLARSGARNSSGRQIRPITAVVMGLTALLLVSATLHAGFCMATSLFPGRGGPALRLVRSALPSQSLMEPSLTSEWRLGVGHAIDVLRKDVPALFAEEQYTPDFSIYGENIEVADARLPSFQLNGLATYQRILSTLQWSVRTACLHRRMEITSMTPPVNNEIYMRWRLTLQFKDVLAPARGLLSFGTEGKPLASTWDVPFIVEGYSRYEFDPWSAAIVKHTIDITNPPMYISDLVQYAKGMSWAAPNPVGLGLPSFHISAPVALAPTGSMSRFVGTTPVSARRPGDSAPRSAPARSAGSLLPFLPKGFGCEDDFECNDGKANFPLQCCELPILGKYCCEPPDAEPVSRTPAYVPIPVPVDNGRRWA